MPGLHDTPLASDRPQSAAADVCPSGCFVARRPVRRRFQPAAPAPWIGGRRIGTGADEHARRRSAAATTADGEAAVGAPGTDAAGGATATQRGIASAALIITVGNLLARLFGLGRETLAAGFFGTGPAIAPFVLADSMLTILYDLLISGMVAAALVPVLSDFGAPERRGELRRVVGTLLTLALIVMGAVTALLIWAAPTLVPLWLAIGQGLTRRWSRRRCATCA